MREQISSCERSFIIKSIQQNQRLDGRTNNEFRDININFGARWGSVVVTLNDTKVVAEVSCELSTPKSTRPNEGDLRINIELRSVASTVTETGRSSELAVKLTRTLERTFKESRCVDLESLCVVAEEHAWTLRVDITVLNNDGNLIDCCSIATLCALAHFKRPDISKIEDDIVIYTPEQKEPIPIVLHHYPVCVSYCTFDEGRVALADPTLLEERVAESHMIFGLNTLQELCCFNLGGTTLTSSRLLLQCVSQASNRAKAIVGQIKLTLAEHNQLRDQTDNAALFQTIRMRKVDIFTKDALSLQLRDFSFAALSSDPEDADKKMDVSDEGEEVADPKVVSMGKSSAILKSNQNNIQWIPDDSDDDCKVNFVNELNSDSSD